MHHLMKKYKLGILLSFIIVVCLILFYKLFFKEKEDIRSILSTKDFTKFEYFIKQESNANDFRGHWKYLREVTHEFKEGVFEFEQYIKDKKGRKTNSYEVFQVNLITSGNKIIYYEFNIQKNKNVKYEWLDSYSWKPYYVLIEKFKDKLGFEQLKKSFKKTFHSELNENELFITYYVYGESCGAGGMNSRERIQLNYFITKQDKDSIIRWLKSTNTEKQIYAIEGVFKLENSGIKFSKTELEIVENMINKKGTIQICSGCIYSVREISSIINQIKANA